MDDQVLLARLSMLEQNLKSVVKPSQYQTNLSLQNVRLQKKVWGQLDKDIGSEVKGLLDQIEDIRKKANLEEAWRAYTEVKQRSQEIFSECLEFLGGLAFRDKLLDESICQLADELIGTWSDSFAGPVSLTVPAARDTLTRTLGRIVRLRFPEWTIWTLPFTAHAYGHVVIDDEERLRDKVKAHAAAWVDEDVKLKRVRPADKKAAATRAEMHAHVLMADAFATYIMGPAYACAAILLRFDPIALSSDSRFPADSQRASVVLGMLKQMNQSTPGAGRKPYTDMIIYLEQKWNEMATSAGHPAAMDAVDKARLDALAPAAWKDLDRELGPGPLYPHDATSDPEGWTRAEEWAGRWGGELMQKNPLTMPPVSIKSQLRTVLNAAWACRLNMLEVPGQDMRQTVSLIGEAADKLCQLIIEEKDRSAETGGGTDGRSPQDVGRRG